jgi:carbonic anhydrase
VPRPSGTNTREVFNDLISANASFAQTDAKDKAPAIPFLPNRQVYLVTCIDPRVDPAALFALELGDAIVARNVGGRVTRAVLEDLDWINYLHATKTPDAGWYELVVLHHTDCGSALMADPDLRAGFTALGHDDQSLRQTAVTDPRHTVPLDVQLLLDRPSLPDHVLVSGYSYDVRTGLVTEVAPPRSRR